MKGKCWIDVDAIRGGSFRHCSRSFQVGTINGQNQMRSTFQPQIRPSNYHRNFRQRSLFIIKNSLPIGYFTQSDDDRDNIHSSNKRIMRFDNFVNKNDKFYYRFQPNRRNTDGTSKIKSTASDQNSDSSVNATVESKSNRGTDPAFVSYLTGDIKPQSILNELTKLSATSILNQRRTAAAKRSRSFALDTNNDKALYRQIIDFQVSQKEKSHRKTAFNVNRALIGNVIICTGKSYCKIAF
jgi:hypothetical protein